MVGTTSAIQASDHWVSHPQGRLFARQWQPDHKPSAAPAIVMLHDSLGCVELWRDFPALVCTLTGRRVVAYDRLGFGRSDPRGALPSLDFVAEEAAMFFPAVRAQLRLESCVALGHSVGGGMAIEIAAQQPQGCQALVTIAAQVFAEDRTLQGIRAAKEQFKDPAQVERLARYHGANTRWVLDAWIDNWLDPAFAWRLEPVLPRVVCPVLALHGALDEYGSDIHPTTIARLAGGPVQLELLAATGHVPHREKPDAIGRLIADFLRDHAGGNALRGSSALPETDNRHRQEI